MDSSGSITVLYQQYAYLTSDLARVNSALSSLASKKAQLDRLLEGEPSLLRAKRRKTKQNRFLTTKSLEKVQREQRHLVQNLRATEAEMSRVMVQYQYNVAWVPTHMQHYPTSTYVHPEMSVDITNRDYNAEPQWPANWNYATMHLDQASTAQDFTYPRETGQPETESMDSLPSRPDSGFEEPAMFMMPFDLPINYDASQHVYSHEMFLPQGIQDQRPAAAPQAGTVIPNQIFPPPISAMPTRVEDLVSPRTISELQHADPQPEERQDVTESLPANRRYSEAAVQMIERRLSEKQHKSRHQRHKSSGNFSTGSGVSISSSTYSPVVPKEEHRTSVAAIAEGLMGALDAASEWLH